MVGRDGFQGWSRKAEASWDRAFRHLLDCDPELRVKYCNNEVDTPPEQRCWKGDDLNDRTLP